MKTISTFTLAAVMALGALATGSTTRDTDSRDHGKLILPRPVVAFDGTDGGCVRLPGDDKHHPVRTESRAYQA